MTFDFNVNFTPYLVLVKQRKMINKSLIFRVLFFISILSFSVSLNGQVSPDAGKALFKENCASCHNKNMKDKLTGPALAGYAENWADYPEEDLYKWIRNSSAMIAEGHPRATELWKEWSPTVMTSFPNLKDDEIASILAYVDGVSNGTYGPKKPDATASAAGGQKDEGSNSFLFITLFVILALLALVLARIVSNLNHMAQVKDGVAPSRQASLLDTLTSKGVVGFLIFALVVLGGYTTVNNAIDLGRQQGYQPEQPIKFSHVTHAGIQKIECQYCHDGARRSKHSVIPAANTCMNCHKAVKKGSKYGTAEISKIYASIGYDPIGDKYIENYDAMSQEEIEKLYKGWIGTQYMETNGVEKLGSAGERVVKEQWEGIVSSLTNKQKKKIQGPIEWVRIHNLPDHVYFNHAQHVSVGKVECQQCHGAIEEMEVVEQYSPLSMGWCINCHRETEVQFLDNEYYKSYTTYHEEFKKDRDARKGVTVEEIGGLECQKCHY